MVAFGVTLWMYGTPVAYSLDIFRTSFVYPLFRFNPMTPIIEMVRYGFLGSEAGSLDWIAYIVSWGITLFLTITGILMFNKIEKTFMDTV